MKELEYPFAGDYILSKKKSIRKQLLARDIRYTEKRIAILGGSTTADIKALLELFLLDHAIKAEFYESEYNKYFEDAMFDPEELVAFKPDLIFIHTTSVNIKNYPSVRDPEDIIEEKLLNTYEEFESMWEHLHNTYHCPIIQNNMEYPTVRLLGNSDCVNIHGRVNFINRLNAKFAEYARLHDDFYIHDINYLSAVVGLDRFSDPFYWFMYKYAVAVPVIPEFAFSLSNMIKAIYGKNKKAFVLDLDNTLWGGVVGDDGPENLEIGKETAVGEAYLAFQDYIRSHKDIGVLLNISSKNEEENALAGLRHKDGVLKPDDFTVIKANWEPKSTGIVEIAEELNLGVDSFVFVDDNPAEREIVEKNVEGIAVPVITTVDRYMKEIDRHGYFEVLKLSEDDLARNEMYKANIQRSVSQRSFLDYGEYLRSLDMKAVIKPFEPVYYARIAQLTNKSNQFNLTTKRYSLSEIEEAASDRLTFYGKLSDKFGDNGVVTVAIGRREDDICHMELWLMSCRVLKRDMELALLDYIVHTCIKEGIKEIRGYYYPTAKNAMVKNFYGNLGFDKIAEAPDGSSEWKFVIGQDYQEKNHVIAVNSEQD